MTTQDLTIDDVVEIRADRRNPQDYPDLPYIGMEDIESQTMRLLTTRPSSEMKSSSMYFESGDILYGRLRPYLNKVYSPDFNGLCSSEFIVMKPTKIKPKLLQYFLNRQSFVSSINRLNTGDRPRVKYSQFKDWHFPDINTTNQQKIVDKIEELFSVIDDTSETLLEFLVKEKVYKASLLNSAFNGQLTTQWRSVNSSERVKNLLEKEWQERKTNWKKNYPKRKFKKPQKTDTSKLPKLPNDWSYVSILEIAKNVPNAVKAGPFGSSLKKSYFVPSGYKIYGQEQVIKNDPFFGDYYINQERYELLKSCAVYPGDVLISLVGTTGKVLILPEGIEPGIINPRLVKITFDERFIEPSFFALYMKSPQFSYFQDINAHGATMKILNLSILNQLPIPLPPLKEQKQIVSLVNEEFSILTSTVSSVKFSLLKNKSLKQSILKQAFEGKLI